MPIDIRVLGPITVGTSNGELSLGPKLRRLLAALVIADGQAISAERLTEAVWYGETPPAGSTTLASNITRLRQQLDGATIEHRTGGYALLVDEGEGEGEGEIDVRRFEQEISTPASARRTARTDAIEHALARWHGNAYEEYADEPWAYTEAQRLEDRRASVAEELLDGWCEAGELERVLAEVDSWVERHPFRWRCPSSNRVLRGFAAQGDGDLATAMSHWRSGLELATNGGNRMAEGVMLATLAVHSASLDDQAYPGELFRASIARLHAI